MKRPLRVSPSVTVLPCALIVTLRAAAGRRAGDGAGRQAAGHGLHRGSDVGGGARPRRGRHDDGHHRHGGHRAERPAHGGRRAQVRHGVRRRQDRARARQDARRAGHHLRAGRQLGESRRPHGQAGHDHAARGSLRRAARRRRPQPEVGRLQDDPLPRRIRRQLNGMRTAVDAAERAVRTDGSAKAFWIDDYYTKSHNDQNAYITKTMGIPANEIGGHANLLDTSEMMFVNPKHVRTEQASRRAAATRTAASAAIRRSRRRRSARSSFRSKWTTRWRRFKG